MKVADSHIAEEVVDIVIGIGRGLVRTGLWRGVNRRGQVTCRFLLGSNSWSEGKQCAARGAQRLPKDLGGLYMHISCHVRLRLIERAHR